MNPLDVLLHAKIRIARHALGGVRHESRLKIAVLSVAAVALWVGAFLLFLQGFLYIQRSGLGLSDEGLRLSDLVMARLLGVLALALFFMLMFSNILIAFSTLYRASEVAYLIQTPLTFRQFFLARFVECVAFSSWASAYLGSPLIIAYGIVIQAPPMFYIVAVGLYLPFVAIPAALGNAVTMLLVRIFPRLRPATLIALALVFAGGFGLYIWQIFKRVQLTDEAIFSTLIDATQPTQSAFSPAYWATQGILSTIGADYAQSFFYLLLLLANALMVTWLAAELAQAIFHTGWSQLYGNETPRRNGRSRSSSILESLTARMHEPLRALVRKDIKLFWRDPVQWSQFILFFGLMAVYVANLRNTSTYGQHSMWRHGVVALNAAACTLILATLTSRFVFPLISLEGRRFWILGLAPVTLKQLVWQKFWLSSATTMVFTIGLVVLSCTILRVNTTAFIVSVYAIIVTNFALSGLAVGLGCLFPNFQENNPARIVSGMGGTLNFLLSMGYVALIVFVQSIVLTWEYLGTLDFFQHLLGPNAFPIVVTTAIALITALSLACTLLPMRLGIRNLQRSEF